MAVDHAIGVERQVRAHNLPLMLQEEAVVGPDIAPRRLHSCRPAHSRDTAVEVGVQECGNSFDLRAPDRTEFDRFPRHGRNRTSGRDGISEIQITLGYTWRSALASVDSGC